MITLRPATIQDFTAIYDIFQAVTSRGDSFAFPPDMPMDAVRELWMGPGNFAYVACEGETILGSYTFHANQPGRGAHVANAAYIVSEQARGKGVGRLMGEHSLITAKEKGFLAMQFNIVVSVNEPAVRLWRSLGFEIIGTTPKGFDHAVHGLVDTYIMHRIL